VVDYAGGGSAIEMKKTLRKILNTLDFDVVIPGHGPISKRADVEQFIKNMDTLHTRMLELIRKGVPKDQTMVSQLKLDDLGWVNSATGKPDPNALWARSITQYCDELIAANK
jgi:glyoxylase-like metal-dependent hydrolase (beta-lactamase superfamily II)